MSDEVNIKNGGVDVTVSLAELADIDMTDVEVSFGGFSDTPPSIALWRVLNMEFKSFGEHTVVQVEMECEKCYTVKSESVTEETMIGVKHNESFFIKDIALDIGKVKGFLEKIGMQGVAKLSDAMEQATGHSFVAQIKHARNKNDPDKPYVNMDIKGIMLQEEYEAAAA